MRYVVELPGHQTFPLEAKNLLISKGANISRIPSAEQMALPGENTVSEEEFEKFISITMSEKTSNSKAVFKRIRKELGGNRG